MAKKWIQLFNSLSSVYDGYTKENVTPYMHAMVYHVLTLMRKHGGIKKFTGQGIEQNNDDCRSINLTKSNKWDAAKDVLLVSNRVEILSSFRRTPSMYPKRNAQYWDNDLKEKQAKIKHKMKDENKQIDANIQSNDEPSVESMSPAELRAGFKHSMALKLA
ncbi:Hypothetical predicted protein [Paramuricea clavata]|uniref:Uncharacterized protein n=1 Tax=Paramuricea clavata TaxID=317549 RepID=A0A6S7K5L0_PARCT|nr:Hypothetical predicted protein [Paramuricea clavata]